MISNVIEANMKKVEWKSEANQDIEAFTEVVRNQDYVFSKVPLEAITTLQKTIASIETEPPKVVIEAARKWYLDYEDVRDAVFLEFLEMRFVKPNNNENTVENRYQPLQEELEKLKEKKMKSNGLTYRELQFQTLKFLLKPESP